MIFAWVNEHQILASADLCCKLIDYFLTPLCLRESKFAFLFHGLLPALISYCQERKESQHVRLYLILFPCKFCHLGDRYKWESFLFTAEKGPLCCPMNSGLFINMMSGLERSLCSKFLASTMQPPLWLISPQRFFLNMDSCWSHTP